MLIEQFIQCLMSGDHLVELQRLAEADLGLRQYSAITPLRVHLPVIVKRVPHTPTLFSQSLLISEQAPNGVDHDA